MVSERCGLCGVQGSLLNQYPAVRPQFRDVPLSLKREEWLLSAAASLRVSCHFSSCNQKTKNSIFYLIHIHSILQLYGFLMCLKVFCVSLPFLPSATVGSLLVCVIMLPFWPEFPWKTHFNFRSPSFLKKGQTKTQHALNLLLVVVIQTADWQD